MTAKMRSAVECMAKARAMEAQAAAFGAAEVQASYLELARRWRRLAGHAEWQDTPRQQVAGDQ